MFACPSSHFLQGWTAVTCGWDNDWYLCWALVQHCISDGSVGWQYKLFLPSCHPPLLLLLPELVSLHFCCFTLWNAGGDVYWRTFNSSLTWNAGKPAVAAGRFQQGWGTKNKCWVSEYSKMITPTAGMCNSACYELARCDLWELDSLVRTWMGTSCTSQMWN